jgi:hypothetical protein
VTGAGALSLGATPSFVEAELWGRIQPPLRRKATAGGRRDAIVGTVVQFIVCVQIIPEGEGQLTCILSALLGGTLGGPAWRS